VDHGPIAMGILFKGIAGSVYEKKSCFYCLRVHAIVPLFLFVIISWSNGCRKERSYSNRPVKPARMEINHCAAGDETVSDAIFSKL
jgi:hypothetical protein